MPTESSVVKYLISVSNVSPGKVSYHFSSEHSVFFPSGLTFTGTLSQGKPPKSPPDEMNLEET